MKKLLSLVRRLFKKDKELDKLKARLKTEGDKLANEIPPSANWAHVMKNSEQMQSDSLFQTPHQRTKAERTKAERETQHMVDCDYRPGDRVPK